MKKTPSPPRSGGEGQGEEARWLDETAPLSNSLPAGRGERENAAVQARHIRIKVVRFGSRAGIMLLR